MAKRIAAPKLHQALTPTPITAVHGLGSAKMVLLVPTLSICGSINIRILMADVDLTWCVDDVDLVVAPRAVRRGRLNRDSLFPL